MGLIKTAESKGKRLLTSVVTRIVKTPPATRDEIFATPPKRVLVIRQHNQMGDMLLAVPALRAIKESLAGVEVTILTAPINRDVMINSPYVDKVITYNSRRPLDLIPLIRGMRRDNYDIVIVLHTVSFSFSSAVLGLLSGSRFRIGSTSLPFGNRLSDSFYHLSLPLPSANELDKMNEAEHNLYPLAAIAISTDDISPLLVPTASDKNWADGFLSGATKEGAIRLAVHPGAGKIENIWPPEKFADVVNGLSDRVETSVIAVEGPRDAESVARFCRLAEPATVVLKGRRIGEVAAVMQKCDLVLCNDTGVMHVASAAGARTLAVFGPTDPARWAPRCSNLHLVRSEDGSLEAINAEDVLARTIEILGFGSG